MAIKIKVNKGIPISREREGRPTKYPWLEMKVGDSFAYPSTANYTETRLAAKSNASNASKRYAPKKFVARGMKDHVRVWRTK
jgi:hypothetical protein